MISKKGFTLVELSIVLVIIGILISGVIMFFDEISQENKQSNSEKHIEEIKEAILSFYAFNGYIPSPAGRDDVVGSPNYGVSIPVTTACAGDDSDCSDSGTGTEEVRIGVLPTRNLGLPDEYMFDKWGNRLSFAVIHDLTVPSGACGAYVVDGTPAGVIQINGIAGSVIQNPATCDGSAAHESCPVVAYTIISHGKNGIGAYNRAGTENGTCSGTTAEGENCDNDNIFTDRLANSGEATAASLYDDIIEWELLSRMDTKVREAGLGDNLPNGASFVMKIERNTSTGDSHLLFENLSADSNFILECLNCSAWEIKNEATGSYSSSNPYTAALSTSSGNNSIDINPFTTPAGVDAEVRVCSEDNFDTVTRFEYVTASTGGRMSLTEIFEDYSSNFNMNNLTTLEMQRADFALFPSKITDFTNLTYIRIGNLIDTIPTTIENLVNLDNLTLRGNELTSPLPVELFNLPTLRYFDVYGNNLTTLPDAISNLTGLEQLHIRDQGLTDLPSTIADIDGLRSIQARRLSLTQVNFSRWVSDIRAGLATNFCRSAAPSTSIRLDQTTASHCTDGPTFADLEAIAASPGCTIGTSPVYNDGTTHWEISNDTTRVSTQGITCPAP